MSAIMQQAHDTETGMIGCNNEAELSAIVKLDYLNARDTYDMQREDKAGVDRNYAQRFIGKPGEPGRYTGRILAVGISYFRKDESRKHECKVEVLREKI